MTEIRERTVGISAPYTPRFPEKRILWRSRQSWPRVAVIWEPRDLWVGVFVALDAVYVCPIPTIVLRIRRSR